MAVAVVVRMETAGVGLGVGVAVEEGWEQPIAAGRTRAMVATIPIAAFGKVRTT